MNIKYILKYFKIISNYSLYHSLIFGNVIYLIIILFMDKVQNIYFDLRYNLFKLNNNQTYPKTNKKIIIY